MDLAPCQDKMHILKGKANPNFSLVEFEYVDEEGVTVPTVELVEWVNAGRKGGAVPILRKKVNPVNLGWERKGKYEADRLFHAGSTTIILPDVGFGFASSRKKNVPESLLLLKRMWEQAIESAVSARRSTDAAPAPAEEAEVGVCAKCGRSKGLKGSGRLTTCPICLLAWHQRCSREIYDKFKEGFNLGACPLGADALPTTFAESGALCCACQGWISGENAVHDSSGDGESESESSSSSSD